MIGFTTAFVSVQSSEDCGGAVEQPARKISAKKMIPANLNTRQLCGTGKGTQAVSRATCLRHDIRT
jgi:hypothetical protein